mmetsp:Transcript_69134/g.218701  ORF Transcript_69134/g.218701 Transcript_69134/m.218701 type:complete len:248 (+) Transcript_69134:386-1129(+)
MRSFHGAAGRHKAGNGQHQPPADAPHGDAPSELPRVLRGVPEIIHGLLATRQVRERDEAPLQGRRASNHIGGRGPRPRPLAVPARGPPVPMAARPPGSRLVWGGGGDIHEIPRPRILWAGREAVGTGGVGREGAWRDGDGGVGHVDVDLGLPTLVPLLVHLHNGHGLGLARLERAGAAEGRDPGRPEVRHPPGQRREHRGHAMQRFGRALPAVVGKAPVDVVSRASRAVEEVRVHRTPAARRVEGGG